MDVETGRVIGHPVKRHWYAGHAVAAGPATVQDTEVQDVIAQVFGDDELTDLGGGSGLNLLSPSGRDLTGIRSRFSRRSRSASSPSAAEYPSRRLIRCQRSSVPGEANVASIGLGSSLEYCLKDR